MFGVGGAVSATLAAVVEVAKIEIRRTTATKKIPKTFLIFIKIPPRFRKTVLSSLEEIVQVYSNA